MKVKPILFGTPMVKAILNNSKTQTRRIIKFPLKSKTSMISIGEGIEPPPLSFSPMVVGDILWVRETWQDLQCFDYSMKGFAYKADNAAYTHAKEFKILWKPSIFMPKEAARIFLKVTNVRVERLNQISEKDAIAEGITEARWTSGWKNYIDHNLYLDKNKTYDNYPAGVYSYATLWESINGGGSWNLNPWVWVYEFEKIDKPANF